jgi:hypothetical protein
MDYCNPYASVGSSMNRKSWCLFAAFLLFVYYEL